MITLTRRLARRLRGVLRRSALGLPRTGPISPLVLRADGRQLRAQYRHEGIAVEHVSPCPRADSGAVAVPLEALADFEGRDETPVVLEPAGPGRVSARWADRGVPASRSYEAPDPATLPEMPGPPDPWHESTPGLLDALAGACAAAGEDSPRHALGCIQLRGGRGELAATDGRQLLVQGGFALPWPGDLLVAGRPAFARPELPRDDGVDVGLAGDRVALRAGPWTIWLAVRPDVRYPDVDRALPAGAAATRLRLHPADARFLAEAIDRLPGDDGAVTLDLGAGVVVRARGDGGPPTELVLDRSSHAGPPARVAMHRDYLARAARLGFDEVEVGGPEAPLCGRDGRRVYAWQPVGEAAVVGPDEGAARVASTAAEGPAPARIAATATAVIEAASSPPSADGTTETPGTGGRPARAGGGGPRRLRTRPWARPAPAPRGWCRRRLRAEREQSAGALASTIAQLRQIRPPGRRRVGPGRGRRPVRRASSAAWSRPRGVTHRRTAMRRMSEAELSA